MHVHVAVVRQVIRSDVQRAARSSRQGNAKRMSQVSATSSPSADERNYSADHDHPRVHTIGNCTHTCSTPLSIAAVVSRSPSAQTSYGSQLVGHVEGGDLVGLG